ncbi:MAG: hypothetical protein L6R38_005535 [Xanthoria sp. 2 TBL-2021]|nr:MAG: hypothetical protein L6R38_005535 [Xanthoria sp. 2 TBL-2021]
MSQQHVFTYSTITGYFLQDEDSTEAENFDFDFGLLKKDYEADASLDPGEAKIGQWQRFEPEVTRLQDAATEGTVYKVLYLGRHGQGVHNVAEKKYGTAEWDRYWAAQEGDSTSSWVDPHLTDTGIQQAQTVNAFWKHQLAVAKTPAPERYYCSPLYRCLETANLTFTELDLPADRPYKPVVKELLREANGIHTCDRRSPKSSLLNAFPNFVFEPSMTENDELWSATERESNEELDKRIKLLLDDVFEHDDSTFVSLTSHSGAICSLLRVLGHREFRLVTGGVIPVLVKAVGGGG